MFPKQQVLVSEAGQTAGFGTEMPCIDLCIWPLRPKIFRHETNREHFSHKWQARFGVIRSSGAAAATATGLVHSSFTLPHDLSVTEDKWRFI